MRDRFGTTTGRLSQLFIVALIALLIGGGVGQAERTTTPVMSPAAVTTVTPPQLELKPGQVVTVQQAHGAYLQYIPTKLGSTPDIVVIVHGTPGQAEDILELVHFYIENWIAVAEQQGAILIAPVFDQENFGSRTGPLGGYRGLFGRQVDADAFVLQLVDQYQQLFRVTDRRFYLYGHSAGGQFVGRFIVRHPEQVKAAVISAAATFPYPDPAVAWPDGMGELHTTARWHESGPVVRLDLSPDPEGWLAAATLPVTVVVGLDDMESQPDRPGQRGNIRVAIAGHWVQAMHALAAQHGLESTIKLSMVPGLGHSSAQLLPYCQEALFPSTNNPSVTSPDGRIRATLFLREGVPYYTVSRAGQPIIQPSKLGFILKEAPPLNQNLVITQIERHSFDETWEQPWGEVRAIRNHYNELRIHLQEKRDLRRHMVIVFRVYDDGLGFRYELPAQENLTDFQIMAEETEFALAGDHQAWWIPAYQDKSYEYLYTRSPLSTLDKVHTPLTMETATGLFLSIHEASLINYAAMTLAAFGQHSLRCDLVPWSDGVKVKAATPFQTPWRTLQVAENAGDLITSYLSLNLNEPNKLGDVAWVKPGKYIGIWWGMHLGRYSWGRGGRHGATTDRAKSYIDFAAKHGFDGVLVEGWNYGWDGDWWAGGSAFDFTRPYTDFDIEEVSRYALAKGVRLIGHHETGGGVANYERQMEAAFALYEKLGVNLVKTGYAGRRVEGTEWHDGQFMVQHQQRVIETAARHKLMLNIHEPVKDAGLRRTYPNLMTSEGARGTEYDAKSADGGNPPEHTTILPFTRLLAGPLDFTPGIFDLRYEETRPYNRVNTTLAKQLALYVVIYSPWQMAADLPENYENQPALQFIVDVPVDWQETKVLQAQPGDFVTIARQDRHSADWYIGSITDENGRTLTAPLTFLQAGQAYVAEIYADTAEAHWESNPFALDISKFLVDRNTSLQLKLAPGGGQAIRLRLATPEETDRIPAY